MQRLGLQELKRKVYLLNGMEVVGREQSLSEKLLLICEVIHMPITAVHNSIKLLAFLLLVIKSKNKATL